ncbi:SGNH/GDSL hydrolase family protein [Streptomyces sp. SID5910]|uniref:SGNH/GDSL hydrolase family protein n=1 Tax=Streptomyces sp. SID5910 TaxID=2690312 RepID=UPI00136EE470|nr:SGNH/GDSL hydrolase family protein [Streptomyces sp. SID5910]MYR43075.1 hypothetical protein [Streptomyces sp. SID5910]
MAIPAGIATVVVTGRYIRPDGSPLTGTVVFEPPARLTFPNADTISAGAATVALDAEGAFVVTLIATDVPGMQPEEWTYTVTERMARAPERSYAIALPSSTTAVDLADVAPANPADGEYVIVTGPAGKDGSQILSGTGAPPASIGADGDYYIDTTTGAVQLHGPKAAGAWPTGVALGGGGSGAVSSVNGQTGAVNLTAVSVGAVPSSGGTMTGDLNAPAVTTSGTSTFANIRLGASANFGGGADGAMAIQNVGTPPPSSPSQGVVLFAQGDVLKVRQANGSTVTIGASSSPAAGTPGIYAPPGWGQFWRAKRDAAGTGKATIAVVGGSASQGMYASNPRTKSWPGVVASSLQSAYGDGGSGFQQTSLSSAVLASGDAAALAAWTTAGAVVTQTGTWSQGGSKYGPGANYIYSDTTGNTLSFKARGTVVKIFTVVGSGTRPNMLYSIDGGADVSVAQPSGAAAIQVTTITGLSNTTHTVVIKVGTASSGQYLSVCGVSGENTTGVVVHNLALAGAKSETYALNATTALNSTWNGGVDYPADLCIYTAGPNDAAANVDPDVWAANVAKWTKAVKDTGTATGNTDIIIAVPHLGKHDVTNFKYQDYALRARALADVYGCAVVNWWLLGRNSWEYWSGLGYWGTNAGTGAAGTDSVHMSDAGFQFMADAILPLLTS